MSAVGRSYLVDAPGVNVLIIDRETKVNVGEIATVEEARSILDRLDAAILQTRTALDQPGRTAAWQRQARYSLRAKCLARPRVTARIQELQQLAKAARAVGGLTPEMARMDARRQAFVDAAYAQLGRDVCEQIWARARSECPAVFATKGASA